MQPTGDYFYYFICTLLLRVDFSTFYPYCTCKRQCHKILTIFSLLKRFDLGHIWTGLVLQPFLFLRKYSVAKFENRVSEQSLTSQTCNFFFRYGDYNYCQFLLFQFFLCFLSMKKNIFGSEDFQNCQFFISNFSYILIKLYYQFRCILKMPDSWFCCY